MSGRGSVQVDELSLVDPGLIPSEISARVIGGIQSELLQTKSHLIAGHV